MGEGPAGVEHTRRKPGAEAPGYFQSLPRSWGGAGSFC